MVQEKIRKLLPEMTPKFREIGSYILDHDQSVAFASIYAVSEASGASNASLVRFAKSLGFEGYQKMKRELQDDFRRRLSPYEKVALADLDALPEEKRLQKLFQNETSNLKETLDIVRYEDLAAVVRSVRNARNVFLCGFGISRYLAGMFEYMLRGFTGKGVTLISGSVFDYAPALNSFAVGDTMILITFPTYSEEVKHVAKVVKERGGTLNLITDSVNCPVYPLADTTIRCITNSILMTNSYVGPQSVLQILAHMIFLDAKDTAMETRSRTIKLQKDGYGNLQRGREPNADHPTRSEKQFPQGE